MQIDYAYLERCIVTMEKALERMQQSAPDSIDYDLYRSATIKEFELILEQAGKLLKKCLTAYVPSVSELNVLFFKDIFRKAANYNLLTVQEVERWLQYRDARNATSHDYGAQMVEETLPLMPNFIADAKRIVEVIKQYNAAQRKG